MARPSVTAPIVSATSIAQLNELMQSTEVKLDRAALDWLDTASG
jgi:aryl-alcohol dehydrogenase-like predicted oxidoreductase